MNSLSALKVVKDDFQIEWEVISPLNLHTSTEKDRTELVLAIQDVDEQISLCVEELAKLNGEIDKLTNHADGFDYAIAVVSGIITGLIDSFFVGETEIDIEKIQEELEKKYHVANDDKYKHKNKDGRWIDSPMYHRLDDLAHHPTLLGLMASILVRYFRLVVFIDGTDGKPHIFFADKSENEATRKLEREQLQKAWIGIVISGLFMWLATIAEKKCAEEYDGDLPEPLRKIIKALGHAPLVVEILKTADTWLGHMMSDVSTAQGIPGIFLSLLKEISVLPVIRNTNFPVIVDRLYREGKFTMSEWGGVVFTAAKKQAMPVLINEILVRGFYFVRRLLAEHQNCQNIKEMNWETVIPFGNRTVERMMTIASGTFTAVDIADATIRSSGFNVACLLRVNFVGVGRFAIAVGTDAGMGMKRSRLVNERINAMSRELSLLNAKVYYRGAQLHYAQSDMLQAEEVMWVAARETEQTLAEAYQVAEESAAFVADSVAEVHENLEKISSYRTEIEKRNPELLKKLTQILRY